MSSFALEISQLGTHAGTVQGIADEATKISSDLAATGAGDYLMYGVLCGAVAFPVLSAIVNSKKEALAGVGEVLSAQAETLQGNREAYQAMEILNAMLAGTFNS